MAKQILLISLVALFLKAMFSAIALPVGQPGQLVTAAESSPDQGLQATLLITLYGFEPAQKDASGMIVRPAQPNRTEGLGTLVSQDGRQFILTHDHWSLLNEELELVQFRNANQELVAEVRGAAFWQLIQYRDGGTMLLQAPIMAAGKVTAVNLDHRVSLEKGDEVQIIHRLRDGRGGIAVVTARVDSISLEAGVPAFRLRSLNGHQIVQGDSGGGIWLAGQLAGNMWMTETVTRPSAAGGQDTTENDWSVAALLTAGIQEQLSEVSAQPAAPEAASQAAVTEAAPGLPPAMAAGGAG